MGVTVHRQAFSELKMPYDTVVVADFADLECEASAKSVTGTRYEWTVTMARAEQLKFLLWKNDNGWQSASNGYKISNWWDNRINKLLWKGLVQNKCALQREDSMRKDSMRTDSMTDHRLRDLRKQVLEPALEHCASCHSFIKGQGSIT